MAGRMPHASRVEDGVVVQDAEAPPLEVLRPVLSSDPGNTFPVYDDLTGRLCSPGAPLAPGATHPDAVVAHVLAVCAGYAYSDANTVALMMARMGLTGSRCRLIAEYVDAMFIDSNAFLVQSEDGRVVLLAYRGTTPDSVIDWLTDADVAPDTVRLDRVGATKSGAYGLHAGFYRNVRATRFKVVEALRRASRAVPITATGENDEERLDHPMETLYVTGHSLGGAMAAVQTVLTLSQDAYREEFGDLLEATYTYGQPMIGGPSLAEAAAADPGIGPRVIRFVYDRDPVPALPPHCTGTFAHFGREFRIDPRRGPRPASRATAQMFSLGQLLVAGSTFVTRNIPALRWVPTAYRVYDHAPHNYIRALTPPGRVSEFGDYDYDADSSRPR